MAKTYNWTGATGSFTTTTDWLDGSNGFVTDGTLPGSADTASIGSGTISGTGTVGTLQFTGYETEAGNLAAVTIIRQYGGTLTVGGTLTAPEFQTNNIVVLAGATITATGTLGLASTAFPNGLSLVTAQATGATIDSSAGQIVIGGVATFRGGTIVKAFATNVVSTTTGVGDLIVTGAGTRYDIVPSTTYGSSSRSGGYLSIGYGAGQTGTATVAQGATLTATSLSTTINPIPLSIGRYGNGALTVTDAGSAVIANEGMSVGRAGIGSLLIENSAKLTVNNDVVGDGGLSIGAGKSTDATQTGGSGSAAVTSNGSLYVQSSVLVGGDGSTGDLTINGGTVEVGYVLNIANTATISNAVYTGTGTVNVNGGGQLIVDGTSIVTTGTSAIRVGNGTGSVGSLNVSGAGSKVDATGHYISIGNFGVGTASVTQGGTILAGTNNSADPATQIGQNGGTGTLIVSDANSTYTAIGSINIGSAGNGSLLVENGGTVNSGNNPSVLSEGLNVARNAGAYGVLTVKDAGSVLTNVGHFTVGGTSYFSAQAGGIGIVSILNGGVIQTSLPVGYINGTSSTTLDGFSPAAAVEIGASAGSSGSSVTVSGAGSKWLIAGALYAGDGGSGDLSISAGGLVTATSADFGVIANTSSTVSITGTGSTLSLTGILTVGDSGNATLMITNGGLVTATDAVIGFSTGGTGNVDIEGTGSHLKLTGNLTIGGSGQGVVTVGKGTELTVVNNLSVAAGAVFNVVGTVDPATGTISGATTISAGGSLTYTNTLTLTKNGHVVVAGGTGILAAGTITGTGTLEVGIGGNLVLQGPNAQTANPVFSGALPTIQFDDNTGTLSLGSPSALPAGVVISGFSTGDQIGVGVAFGSESYANGVLTLYSDANQTNAIGALTFAAGTVAADVVAGVNAACFASGTRVETTRGPVPIEDLRPGDTVPSATSQAIRTIIWTGRRHIKLVRHPRPWDAQPVRIRAGAFGENRPVRDVILSPDHAIYENSVTSGVLIPIRYLINGVTVVQEAVPEITWHHIELDTHDAILTEGLASESYLDTGNRNAFEGNGTIIAATPDFARQIWDKQGFAPLVTDGDDLLFARTLLHCIATNQGARLTNDPDLHLVCGNGAIIRPTVMGNALQFSILPGTGSVRLCSRHASPADVDPASNDRRDLGVAVLEVFLDHVPATCEAFGEGWLAPEDGFRWTNGDSLLHLQSATTLRIHLAELAVRSWIPSQLVALATAA